jgi:phytoene/squalene synthetase
MTLAALERSYRRAEAVTAEWARSFYFASWFLPAAKRGAVFAIYDYCRHADDLVDQRGTRTAEAVRLARLPFTRKLAIPGRTVLRDRASHGPLISAASV